MRFILGPPQTEVDNWKVGVDSKKALEPDIGLNLIIFVV